MNDAEALALLGRRSAAAAAALESAAGSASLCTLSRSGAPMPGVKYPEGAGVALRDVQRCVDGGLTVADALGAVRARWVADADRHSGSGPDWQSYLTGGIDVLDTLAEDIGD